MKATIRIFFLIFTVEKNLCILYILHGQVFLMNLLLSMKHLSVIGIGNESIYLRIFTGLRTDYTPTPGTKF